MIDIDALEALAKDAAETGMAGHRIKFFMSIDPESVLALISEVRALREDASRYRRLKTFADPSYNVRAISNAGVASLSKEEFLTVHAGSWEAMDSVLDGVVMVNTVNIKEQP